MTTYTQKAAGSNITLLDAANSSRIALTAGEGAPGHLRMIEDQVAVARTDFGTAGNFVRLCRFPATAKLKKVELFTDLSLVDGGTSSSALVLGVGVVFSNSTTDGTPVGYQNLMPTTVGIGGGSTTAGTAVAIGGASSNRLFGTITANGSSGALPSEKAAGLELIFGGEITHNGTLATYGEPVAISQVRIGDLFNFRDGQNNLIENVGFFDLIVIADTAYNTQPAAGYNMYARVTYVG